jgi:arsenical pump membrane protein
MRTDITAEAVSALALIAVLAWAIRRPRGWPEAVAAVPAAVLVIAVGAVTTSAAVAEARLLAPVVGFLGCVLVLSRLCDEDGLFRYLGAWLARLASGRRGGADGAGTDGDGTASDATDGAGTHGKAGDGTGGAGPAGPDGDGPDGARAHGAGPDGGAVPAGDPVRLLGGVFAVAALTTAVLSLDATVVLLTPVVLIAARRTGVRARPHAYACGHLANSASLLLPVSNLTNLLGFTLSGLSFTRFAELMALPWVMAIGVEYGVIRRFFAGDLARSAPAAVPATVARGASRAGEEHRPVPDQGGGPADDLGPEDPADNPPIPVFTLVVVAATLAGFAVASAAGVNPAWAALGGALALAVRALVRRQTTAVAVARAADVPFLLFVLALGVVVTALVDSGLGRALRPLVPTGSALPSLLAFAALAALLAAVLNNLPAVLVLLPLAAPAGTGAVLAVLLGVNIGPNLTYTGSLATLLWRRVLREYDADVSLGDFTRLGAVTVLPALAGAVLALWAALRLFGG